MDNADKLFLKLDSIELLLFQIKEQFDTSNSEQSQIREILTKIHRLLDERLLQDG